MDFGPKGEDAPQALKDRIRLKMESQPYGKRSAGCMFKNPPGDAAGRLIDLAGLKGARVGGVAVSDLHANFMVNMGDATHMDVLTLLKQVRDQVMEAHDVLLETEIQFWPPLD